MHGRLLLLVLFVLPLAFAAPAQAVVPTTVVTTFEDLTFDDTALCSFPVTFMENGTFKVTTFYDRAGNPLKSILSNRAIYTSRATANGKTLLSNYPLVVVTSFQDDTRTELGLFNAFHVPGEGLILINTGRLVIDRATGDVIFEAGQHQTHEGDTSAFCAFFAGP